MTTAAPRGIVYASDQAVSSLPLLSCKVQAVVVDVSAKVVLEQEYCNNEPIATTRAKYAFPLPARAAVCAFEMRRSDGHVLVGVAKEKKEAAREHELAVSEGRATALVEWATDDIFTISIGSVPARQTVTTRLTYIVDLINDVLPNQVRLQLPMVIGERYGVSPPELTDAASIPSSTLIDITARVQMSGSIHSIQSPSHDVEQQPYLNRTGVPSSRRMLVQYASDTFLDRDFVLDIFAEGLDASRCFAERDHRHPGTVALQLTVVPKLALPAIAKQECIFLVDRSGSMKGGKIETAKRTLNMLLRILPSQDTWFNVWSFGTNYQSLWPQSELYGQATLDQATLHVKNMGADLGGTKICPALRSVLSSRKPNIPTSVFVLTDGQVYGIDETTLIVSQAVSQSTSAAPLRVFTLGIGDAASSAECESIARAGNGLCIMADATETLVAKFTTLFRAALSELVNDVDVDWGIAPQDISSQGILAHSVSRDSVASGSSLSPTVRFQDDPSGAPAPTFLQSPSPNHIGTIYRNSRFTVFAIISTDRVPKNVVIRGKVGDSSENLEIQVPVDRVSLNRGRSAGHRKLFLHTLAARRIVTDLQDRAMHDAGTVETGLAAVQPTVVKLGERYQLATRFTSFVAVDGAILRHYDGFDSGAVASRVPSSFSWSWQPLVNLFHSLWDFVSPGQDTLPEITRSQSYGSIRTIPGTWNGSEFESVNHQENEDDGVSDGESDGESTSSVNTFSTLSSLESYTDDDGWRPRRHRRIDDERARAPSPVFNDARQGSVGHGPPDVITPAVFDLVSMQQFDGSFSATDSFKMVVGDDALQQGQVLGLDDRLWATALAIAFIEERLAQQPELREGLLMKAMQCLTDSQITMDEMLKEARRIMRHT